VSDAAFDRPMGILAREHLGVRGRFGMWSTIRVPVCTENLIRVDDVMDSPKLAG
jgi:hypothetical protein